MAEKLIDWSLYQNRIADAQKGLEKILHDMINNRVYEAPNVAKEIFNALLDLEEARNEIDKAARSMGRML